MSRACFALACLLGFGCTDVPHPRDADGGAATGLTARTQLPALDAGTNTWVVRRTSDSATAELAVSDTGHTGLIPVLPVGHDAGRPSSAPELPSAPEPEPPMAADDDDDAGVEPIPPCQTSKCLCGRICERGIALECLAEDPLETCVELCDVASADCYEQLLQVLRCKAALPDAAYSCDPDLFVFVVEGCAVEETALQTCRRF